MAAPPADGTTLPSTSAKMQARETGRSGRCRPRPAAPAGAILACAATRSDVSRSNAERGPGSLCAAVVPFAAVVPAGAGTGAARGARAMRGRAPAAAQLAAPDVSRCAGSCMPPSPARQSSPERRIWAAARGRCCASGLAALHDKDMRFRLGGGRRAARRAASMDLPAARTRAAGSSPPALPRRQPARASTAGRRRTARAPGPLCAGPCGDRLLGRWIRARTSEEVRGHQLLSTRTA